jgi:DNA polymerase III epsilon subunit-like protein
MSDWIKRFFTNPKPITAGSGEPLPRSVPTMVSSVSSVQKTPISESPAQPEQGPVLVGTPTQLSPGELNRQRVAEILRCRKSLTITISEPKHRFDPVVPSDFSSASAPPLSVEEVPRMKPIASPLPPWLTKIPTRVAFVDVETTGLTGDDRVVSFAGILLHTPELANKRLNLNYVHFICDPGHNSHPRAESIHGLTDWCLRHQKTFAENVDGVIAVLNDADLIVAHNVDFDLPFINREFRAAGHPVLAKRTYCTMQACRQRQLGSSQLVDKI